MNVSDKNNDRQNVNQLWDQQSDDTGKLLFGGLNFGPLNLKLELRSNTCSQVLEERTREDKE